MALCFYCNEKLPPGKKRYCNDLHKYRYLSMIKDTGAGRLSKSQCLRMLRAGRAQRAGRVGCRYN
jgi:hypothetical protein